MLFLVCFCINLVSWIIIWWYSVDFNAILLFQIREYEWYCANSKSIKFNALVTSYEILLKGKVWEMTYSVAQVDHYYFS